MQAFVNPFNPYFPATGHTFSNRRQEQEFFRQGLLQGLHPAGPGPWNVALLGPWGIGKTSLLRRFAEMTAAFDPPALAVSLTVTSAIADYPTFARELLARIQEEIHAQSRWPERLRDELSHWEPSISLGAVTASRRAPERSVAPATDLYRELRRLWRDHLAGRVAGMVVLLDDAHLLLAHDAQALLTLRGIFQDLQGLGARYPLVITGPEALFESVRDASEPVTRFFERMALGPFTLQDTIEAVRSPIDALGLRVQVEDDAIEALWQKTGGHPFFVTFAMRDLVRPFGDWRGGTDPVLTREGVERSWPAIADHLARERFTVEWQSATPAEKQVLRALAAEDREVPLTRALGKSGMALLSRLVKKGLVLRSGRGEYQLYHPLFQGFVANMDAETGPSSFENGTDDE